MGYNILTEAAIGESQGLALGPQGVRPAYQSQGAGSLLVEGKPAPGQGGGLPLGGPCWAAATYARFGFEPCAPYGITVSEDAFANEHLQILFFQEEAKAQAAGRITLLLRLLRWGWKSPVKRYMKQHNGALPERKVFTL